MAGRREAGPFDQRQARPRPAPKVVEKHSDNRRVLAAIRYLES
jgi:hypothetical protein